MNIHGSHSFTSHRSANTSIPDLLTANWFHMMSIL